MRIRNHSFCLIKAQLIHIATNLRCFLLYFAAISGRPYAFINSAALTNVYAYCKLTIDDPPLLTLVELLLP
jgi:hypothetical protein